jgi:hypothetical protein
MLIVMIDPVGEGTHQLKGAGPLLQPEARLLERAYKSLRVGIPFRVTVAGKRLMDPQTTARSYKSGRGRLTAVITHQA